MSIVLETERLFIRQFTQNDVQQLYTICNDADLMRYVGNGQPLSLAQVEKWISVTLKNYTEKGFGNYALTNKMSNDIIGYCGLVRSIDIDAIELIYALNKEYQGKGLATEAARGMVRFGLDTIKLESIYASIDPANEASEKILNKLGFELAFERNDEFGLVTRYYVIHGY